MEVGEQLVLVSDKMIRTLDNEDQKPYNKPVQNEDTYLIVQRTIKSD